jgi:hypothetical protein
VRLSPLAALVVALLACGCGRQGDRSSVEGVTASFLQAVENNAAGTACAQLTPDAIKALEQQEQGSCEASIGKLGVKPSRVRAVELYADNAKVDLADGAAIFAEQTARGWRISAVACRATDGDPKSHPMSCALETS